MGLTLEYATAADEFYDYCQYEYVPRTPVDGKLRSSTLLWHSFEVKDCPSSFYDLATTIRTGIGLNRTVWGVKNVNRQLSWEFYFCNYFGDPKLSQTNLLRLMAPYVKYHFEIKEYLPYFMFSVDISPEILASQELPGIHLYVGIEGRRSRGISYFLTKHGLRLENHYAFYNPATEQASLEEKIRQTMWVDFARIPFTDILIPELQDCKSICIANKQEGDCIYFSGLNVEQLMFFLERFAYPQAIISFIRDHQAQLDHLQFDVGFDFRMVGDRLEILKSGYYGTF
jgi:hypothetical protein